MTTAVDRATRKRPEPKRPRTYRDELPASQVRLISVESDGADACKITFEADTAAKIQVPHVKTEARKAAAEFFHGPAAVSMTGIGDLTYMVDENGNDIQFETLDPSKPQKILYRRVILCTKAL